MNSRKRRILDRFLIRRDGYVCGSHIGGCGKETCSKPGATLDHIFPQAFFKDTKALRPPEYDKPWNVQRMHNVCNNEKKGGFLFGFPVFKCRCHWLQIRKRLGKYALEVSYCPSDGKFHRVVVVPYGQFDVEDGRISDPQGLLPADDDHVVAGFILTPDRGMSISRITIDVEAAFAGGRKSFSFVGKAKRGTLRRGENGHTFPLLAPNEIIAFNEFEKNRVKRGGAVNDNDNLLLTFNSEVVPLEVEYDE